MPQNKKINPSLNKWDPIIQTDILKLISDIHPDKTNYKNADVVKEMIITALKGVESDLGRGDLKLLSRSFRELRYAFKIFKSYRNTRKVTIFGSARTKENETSYKMTKDFAKRLVDLGYMIITGAGPGIMQAGNEGAGPKASFGVNIKLPFEQHPNEFIADQPTYIDCHYFFTRKLVFIKEASAAAFFPGGFGTLDEAFELLTLVQTGKSDPIPLVFVDDPKTHFWREMQAFIEKSLLKGKKISPEDLNLYKIFDTSEEAVNEIVHFYSNYHSMRYIGDNLVFRLRKPILASDLKYINKNFSSILTDGQFTKGGPLKEEENQPELQHFHRLIFKFNRMNNGRLRQLIDTLNKCD
ncbi:MAG: LOG family protein [Elusimicrobiota bacterium]